MCKYNASNFFGFHPQHIPLGNIVNEDINLFLHQISLNVDIYTSISALDSLMHVIKFWAKFLDKHFIRCCCVCTLYTVDRFEFEVLSIDFHVILLSSSTKFSTNVLYDFPLFSETLVISILCLYFPTWKFSRFSWFQEQFFYRKYFQDQSLMTTNKCMLRMLPLGGCIFCFVLLVLSILFGLRSTKTTQTLHNFNSFHIQSLYSEKVCVSLLFSTSKMIKDLNILEVLGSF